MSGAKIFFARPDALKGSLGETLRAVKPTLFLGVPRVWEKMAEKMQALGRSTTGIKKSLGSWAKGKGLVGNYASQRGADKPWGWWLANKLVFSTVKEKLGFDDCRVFATGAAPISLETLEYFMSLDIPIMEVGVGCCLVFFLFFVFC